MKKIPCFLFLLLFAVLSRFAEATPPQFNNLTSCQLSSNLNSLTSTCADVPPPNVSIPSLYDGTSNTKRHGSFGADYFRITLPSGITDTTVTQLFPVYSKTPAWNSDGSLLMLTGNDSHFYLFNGTTYQYIRTFPGVYIGSYYWSHTDPDLFYYFYNTPGADGPKLYSYKISTSTSTTLHTFTNADFDTSEAINIISTLTEGNSDDSDRYWAIMGLVGYSTPYGVAVYDRVANTVIAKKNFLAGGLCGTGACPSTPNWVGMSHSGNHVIVQWNQEGDDGDFTTRGTGTESFNRSLTYLVKPSEQNNHMDVATLSNGTDVLVGRSHMTDNNAGRAMRAMNLNNGSIMTTCMLPVENGWHISGRTTSSLLKGWVLFSIWSNSGGLGTGIFASENIALNMDTCEVRRIAHTQSYVSVSNYNAYPFSSMNWDFTKIIWRSNWRNSSNPVQTHIVELTVGTKVPLSPSTIIITP